MNEYTAFWSKDGKKYEYNFPLTESQAKTMWDQKRKEGYSFGGFVAYDYTKELQKMNKKANNKILIYGAAAVAAIMAIYFIGKKINK